MRHVVCAGFFILVMVFISPSNSRAYEQPGPDGKCANNQPKNQCGVNGAIVTVCGSCPSGQETVQAGSGSSGAGTSGSTGGAGTSGASSGGGTGSTGANSGGTQTTVDRTNTNSQKECNKANFSGTQGGVRTCYKAGLQGYDPSGKDIKNDKCVIPSGGVSCQSILSEVEKSMQSGQPNVGSGAGGRTGGSDANTSPGPGTPSQQYYDGLRQAFGEMPQSFDPTGTADLETAAANLEQLQGMAAGNPSRFLQMENTPATRAFGDGAGFRIGDMTTLSPGISGALDQVRQVFSLPDGGFLSLDPVGAAEFSFPSTPAGFGAANNLIGAINETVSTPVSAASPFGLGPVQAMTPFAVPPGVLAPEGSSPFSFMGTSPFVGTEQATVLSNIGNFPGEQSPQSQNQAGLFPDAVQAAVQEGVLPPELQGLVQDPEEVAQQLEQLTPPQRQQLLDGLAANTLDKLAKNEVVSVSELNAAKAIIEESPDNRSFFSRFGDSLGLRTSTRAQSLGLIQDALDARSSPTNPENLAFLSDNAVQMANAGPTLTDAVNDPYLQELQRAAAQGGEARQTEAAEYLKARFEASEANMGVLTTERAEAQKQLEEARKAFEEEQNASRTNISQNGSISAGRTFEEAELLRKQAAEAQKIVDDKALAANQKEAGFRAANEAFAEEARRQGLVAREVIRTREVDTNGAIASQEYTSTEYVDPVNERTRTNLERVQSDMRSYIAQSERQGGLSARDIAAFNTLRAQEQSLVDQLNNRSDAVQRALAPSDASLRAAGGAYSRAFTEFQEASAVAQRSLAAYTPFERQYNTHLQNMAARAADYQMALGRSVAYETEYSNRISNPGTYLSSLASASPSVRLQEDMMARSASLVHQYATLGDQISATESSGLSGANYGAISELQGWRNQQREIDAQLQRISDLQDAYNNSPDPNRFAETYLSTYSANPQNPSMLDRYVQLRGDAQRALAVAELEESAAASVLGPWEGPGSPSVFQDSSSLERRALADYDSAINQLAGITPLTDRDLIAQSAAVAGERGSSLLGDAYTWLARQADPTAQGIEAGANTIYSMTMQGIVKSPIDLAIRGVDSVAGLVGIESIKPNTMLAQDAFMTRDQMGGVVANDAINTLLNTPMYAQGYSAVAGRLGIMDDAAQASAQLAQRAQYMSDVADFVQPQSSAFIRALEAQEAYETASRAVSQLQSPVHVFSRSANTLLAERAVAIDLARVGAQIEAGISIPTIDAMAVPAQAALRAPQLRLTGPAGSVAAAPATSGAIIPLNASPVTASLAEAQAVARWESMIAATDANIAQLTQSQYVARLSAANNELAQAGLSQTSDGVLVRTTNPAEIVALPSMQGGASGRLFETVGGNAPLPTALTIEVTPPATPTVGGSGGGPWSMVVGDMSTVGSGSTFRNTIFGNPAFAPEGLRVGGSAFSNPVTPLQPVIPNVASLVRPIVGPLFPAVATPRVVNVVSDAAAASPNRGVAAQVHAVASQMTNRVNALDALASELRSTNPIASALVEREGVRINDAIGLTGSLAGNARFVDTAGAQALLVTAWQLNAETYPEITSQTTPRDTFDVLLARAEALYAERTTLQKLIDNLVGPLTGPARDLEILRQVQRDLLPGGVSPRLTNTLRTYSLMPGTVPLRIFDSTIAPDVFIPITSDTRGVPESFALSPNPAIETLSAAGVMSPETAKLIREALAAGGISDSTIVSALREVEVGNANGVQLLRDAASPSEMSNDAFRLHTEALEKGLQNNQSALEEFLKACAPLVSMDSVMLAAAAIVPAAAQCSSEPLANELLKLESDAQGIQAARALWNARGGYPSEVAGAVDYLQAAVTEARSSVGLLRGNPASAGLRTNAEQKINAGKDLALLVRGVKDFELFSNPNSAAMRDSFIVKTDEIVTRGSLAKGSSSDPPQQSSEASLSNPLRGFFAGVAVGMRELDSNFSLARAVATPPTSPLDMMVTRTPMAAIFPRDALALQGLNTRGASLISAEEQLLALAHKYKIDLDIQYPATQLETPETVNYVGPENQAARASAINLARYTTEYLNSPTIIDNYASLVVAPTEDVRPLRNTFRDLLNLESPEAFTLYESNKLRFSNKSGQIYNEVNSLKYALRNDATEYARAIRLIDERLPKISSDTYNALPINEKLKVIGQLDELSLLLRELVSGPGAEAVVLKKLSETAVQLRPRDISSAQANVIMRLSEQVGRKLDEDFILDEWVAPKAPTQVSRERIFGELAKGTPADQELVRAAAQGDAGDVIAEIDRRLFAVDQSKRVANTPSTSNLLSQIGQTRVGQALRALTAGLALNAVDLPPISIGSFDAGIFSTIGAAQAGPAAREAPTVAQFAESVSPRAAAKVASLKNNIVGLKFSSVEPVTKQYFELTGKSIGSFKDRGETYASFGDRKDGLLAAAVKVKSYMDGDYDGGGQVALATPREINKRWVQSDRAHTITQEKRDDWLAAVNCLTQKGCTLDNTGELKGRFPADTQIPRTADAIVDFAASIPCAEQSLCSATFTFTERDAAIRALNDIIDLEKIAAAEKVKINQIAQALAAKGYKVTRVPVSKVLYKITKPGVEQMPSAIEGIGLHYTMMEGRKSAAKVLEDAQTPDTRPSIAEFARANFGYMGISENCANAAGCGIALLEPTKELKLPIRINHIASTDGRRPNSEVYGYNWNTIGLASNINGVSSLRAGGQQAFLDMTLETQRAFGISYTRVFPHEYTNVRLGQTIAATGEGVALKVLVDARAYVPEVLAAQAGEPDVGASGPTAQTVSNNGAAASVFTKIGNAIADAGSSLGRVIKEAAREPALDVSDVVRRPLTESSSVQQNIPPAPIANPVREQRFVVLQLAPVPEAFKAVTGIPDSVRQYAVGIKEMQDGGVRLFDSSGQSLGEVYEITKNAPNTQEEAMVLSEKVKKVVTTGVRLPFVVLNPANRAEEIVVWPRQTLELQRSLEKGGLPNLMPVYTRHYAFNRVSGSDGLPTYNTQHVAAWNAILSQAEQLSDGSGIWVFKDDSKIADLMQKIKDAEGSTKYLHPNQNYLNEENVEVLVLAASLRGEKDIGYILATTEHGHATHRNGTDTDFGTGPNALAKDSLWRMGNITSKLGGDTLATQYASFLAAQALIDKTSYTWGGFYGSGNISGHIGADKRNPTSWNIQGGNSYLNTKDPIRILLGNRTARNNLASVRKYFSGGGSVMTFETFAKLRDASVYARGLDGAPQYIFKGSDHRTGDVFPLEKTPPQLIAESRGDAIEVRSPVPPIVAAATGMPVIQDAPFAFSTRNLIPGVMKVGPFILSEYEIAQYPSSNNESHAGSMGVPKPAQNAVAISVPRTTILSGQPGLTYVLSGGFEQNRVTPMLINPEAVTKVPNVLPQQPWVYLIGRRVTDVDVVALNDAGIGVVKVDPEQTDLSVLKALSEGNDGRTVIGYFNGAANQPGKTNPWSSIKRINGKEVTTFTYPVEGYQDEGYFLMNDEGLTFQEGRMRTFLTGLRESGKLQYLKAVGYDNIFGCFESASCRTASNLTAEKMVAIVDRFAHIAHEYGLAFVLKNPHSVVMGERGRNFSDAQLLAMFNAVDAVIAEEAVSHKTAIAGKEAVEAAYYATLPWHKPLYLVEFSGNPAKLLDVVLEAGVPHASLTVTPDGYTNIAQDVVAFGSDRGAAPIQIAEAPDAIPPVPSRRVYNLPPWTSVTTPAPVQVSLHLNPTTISPVSVTVAAARPVSPGLEILTASEITQVELFTGRPLDVVAWDNTPLPERNPGGENAVAVAVNTPSAPSVSRRENDTIASSIIRATEGERNAVVRMNALADVRIKTVIMSAEAMKIADFLDSYVRGSRAMDPAELNRKINHLFINVAQFQVAYAHASPHLTSSERVMIDRTLTPLQRSVQRLQSEKANLLKLVGNSPYTVWAASSISSDAAKGWNFIERSKRSEIAASRAEVRAVNGIIDETYQRAVAEHTLARRQLDIQKTPLVEATSPVPLESATIDPEHLASNAQGEELHPISLVPDAIESRIDEIIVREDLRSPFDVGGGSVPSRSNIGDPRVALRPETPEEALVSPGYIDDIANALDVANGAVTIREGAAFIERSATAALERAAEARALSVTDPRSARAQQEMAGLESYAAASYREAAQFYRDAADAWVLATDESHDVARMLVEKAEARVAIARIAEQEAHDMRTAIRNTALAAERILEDPLIGVAVERTGTVDRIRSSFGTAEQWVVATLEANRARVVLLTNSAKQWIPSAMARFRAGATPVAIEGARLIDDGPVVDSIPSSQSGPVQNVEQGDVITNGLDAQGSANNDEVIVFDSGEALVTPSSKDPMIAALDEWQQGGSLDGGGGRSVSLGGGGGNDSGSSGGGSTGGGSGGGGAPGGGSQAGAGGDGDATSWGSWIKEKCLVYPRMCGILGVLGLSSVISSDSREQEEVSTIDGGDSQNPLSFGGVGQGNNNAGSVVTTASPASVSSQHSGDANGSTPGARGAEPSGGGQHSGSTSGGIDTEGSASAQPGTSRAGATDTSSNASGGGADASGGTPQGQGGSFTPGSGASGGDVTTSGSLGSQFGSTVSGFTRGGMSLLQGLLTSLLSYFMQDSGSASTSQSESQPPIQVQPTSQPVVGTIVANPSFINPGSTTTISWSSVGTDVSSSTCAVITADFVVYHRGGQDGSISSPALTKSTRFGLVCNIRNATDKLLHETLVRVRGDDSDPERIFTPEEIAASQSTPATTGSGGSGGGSGGTNNGGQSGNPTPRDVRTCDPEQSMDSFIRCLCVAEPNPAGCTIPPGGLR